MKTFINVLAHLDDSACIKTLISQNRHALLIKLPCTLNKIAILQHHTVLMAPLSRLHQWDVLILNRVFQGVRYRQHLTNFAETVSRTGDGPFYVVIAIFIWLTKVPQAHSFCMTLALAFAIERPLYFFIKNSFKRNRPEKVVPGIRGVVVPADQFSFPSGHTSAAFCFATTAGMLFANSYNPFFLWAVGIGLSRVILAVHFPGDVIAGAVVGSVIAMTSGFLLSTL